MDELVAVMAELALYFFSGEIQFRSYAVALRLPRKTGDVLPRQRFGVD